MTVLAVGAHIGDMDLTAGPALAEIALRGQRVVLIALTPGERGHPRLSVADYKQQKIGEGEKFAAEIGAELRVFDGSDGFLGFDECVATRIADIIRELKPTTVIGHWAKSIHSDHTNSALITERARYLAGLPMEHELARHGVRRLLFAENWEDAEDFEPNLYLEISDEAFSRWHNAISGESFARGETYGFRYIDYYTALLTMRGCLARTTRACAFRTATPERIVLQEL
jgi:LmbE family N-acetylglucosaminyl deacetylase